MGESGENIPERAKPSQEYNPDFRCLFENAPGLYLVLLPDSKFTIIAVSHAYANATLTHREQIVGHGLFEIFPDNPDDPKATGTLNLRASLNQVLKTRMPDAMAVQKYDIQLPQSQGGGFVQRYWSPINTPILDHSGDIRYIIHQVEDVTEFVRMKMHDVEQEKIAEALKSQAAQMELEIFLRAQQIQKVNYDLRKSQEELLKAKAHLETQVEERTHALKASENQLKLITETLPALISYIDKNKRYQFVNASYETWFHRSRHEIVGKTMLEVLGDKAFKAVSPYVNAVLSGSPTTFDQEAPYKDGGTRHIHGTYVPDFSPSGEVNGFVVLVTDVSEQFRSRLALEQSERKLRESEHLFRTLADNIPQLAWMTDETGWTIWYNQRWYDYTGSNLEEMKGRGWTKVHHPDHLERVLKRFEYHLQSGEPWEDTFPLRKKDGTWRWFLSRAQPVKDSEGKTVRWFGSNTDITEQVQLQEDQRFQVELHSRLNQISEPEILVDTAIQSLARHLQVSRCWLSEIDESTSFARVNHEFSDGLPPLKGTHPIQSFGPEMVKSWQQHRIVEVTNVCTDLRTKDYTDSHLKLGICSFVTIPLHRSGKMIGAMNIASNTPRNWQGREIEIARSTAEEVWSKIENMRLLSALREAIRARDEFLSIASHELKTPLTSLTLQTQIIRRGIARNNSTKLSPERVIQLVEHTEKQTAHLARLIEDMLDIARIRSGKLAVNCEVFDFCKLAVEVIDRMKFQFSNYPGGFPVLKLCPSAVGSWDRLRMEQVLTNLLTNAMKYGRGKPIEVSIEKNENTLFIDVRDQGMGIAQENLSRIFDRFERAISASEVSGLGLGLFIARQIVEAHGGRLFVESKVGEGSVFHIALPM